VRTFSIQSPLTARRIAAEPPESYISSWRRVNFRGVLHDAFPITPGRVAGLTVVRHRQRQRQRGGRPPRRARATPQSDANTSSRPGLIRSPSLARAQGRVCSYDVSVTPMSSLLWQPVYLRFMRTISRSNVTVVVTRSRDNEAEMNAAQTRSEPPIVTKKACLSPDASALAEGATKLPARPSGLGHY
jgi:hypothetical protein